MEEKIVLTLLACFLVGTMILGTFLVKETSVETKTIVIKPSFGSYGELALSKDAQNKVNQSRVILNG